MTADQTTVGDDPLDCLGIAATDTPPILHLLPKGCEEQQAAITLQHLGRHALRVHDFGEAIIAFEERPDINVICIEVCERDRHGIILADVARTIRKGVSIVYIVDSPADISATIGVRHGPVLIRPVGIRDLSLAI